MKNLAQVKEDLDLTETQIQFLKIFSSYKPFARREEWARNSDADYDTLIDTMVALGYLKKNKRGAVSRTTKGYEATGSYHGAEADATRKMWASAFKDK